MEKLSIMYNELIEKRKKQKEAWSIRKLEMRLEGIKDKEIIEQEKSKHIDPDVTKNIAAVKARMKRYQPESKKDNHEYYLKNKDRFIQRTKQRRKRLAEAEETR